MPLSRQTSRIVWPSKPSTTRPSTSMRMRGVDCGRCGDCVSSRRSASASAFVVADVLGSGRRSGRARVSVIGGPRSRPAGDGGRGRTRTRSIASRSSAGGWPGARGRTARTRRCRRRGPRRAACRPGGAGPSSRRPTISARRFVPIRQGIDLPQASFEQKRVSTPTSSSEVGPCRRRPITEPEPRCAPAAAQRREVVGRVERVRRQQPTRRPADQHGLERATGRQLAAELEHVAQRRAERDLGDAGLAAGRPQLDEDRARAAGRVAGLGPGSAVAAKASAPSRTIHGTAARVWTLWTTVGRSNSPRSAGCGGRCSGWPRLPSRALSRTVSSPSM